MQIGDNCHLTRNIADEILAMKIWRIDRLDLVSDSRLGEVGLESLLVPMDEKFTLLQEKEKIIMEFNQSWKGMLLSGVNSILYPLLGEHIEPEIFEIAGPFIVGIATKI